MRHQKNTAPISREDYLFFENFIVKYEKYILHTALKHKSANIQTDDIIQEAEIRLMLHIPTLRKLSHNKICSYISQTIRAVFVDLERQEQKHSYVSMDNILEEMIGTERDLVPDLFIRQELQRLRKGLTAREWMALKSKYVFGYSQEELGKQLDMAPDSVRMFLCRVRKQAQQILSPEKVTGGDGDD